MTGNYSEPAAIRLANVERDQAKAQYHEEVAKLARIKEDADRKFQRVHAIEAKLRAFRDPGDEVNKLERQLEADIAAAKSAAERSAESLAKATKAMQDANAVSGLASMEEAVELWRKVSELRKEAALLEERAATFKLAALELEKATAAHQATEAELNRQTIMNARRISEAHAEAAAARRGSDDLKRELQEIGDPNDAVREQQRIVRTLFNRAGLTGYPSV